MTTKAYITGDVTYREGDGPNIEIPPGPVDVELTPHDATLSWTEGDTRGLTAIPLAEYKRYLASGAIRVHQEARAA